MAAASIVAAILLLLPWVIDRSGGGPAFGPGPLVTATQDILAVRFSPLLASLAVV